MEELVVLDNDWPIGLDGGARVQFTLECYRQPPAKESPNKKAGIEIKDSTTSGSPKPKDEEEEIADQFNLENRESKINFQQNEDDSWEEASDENDQEYGKDDLAEEEEPEEEFSQLDEDEEEDEKNFKETALSRLTPDSLTHYHELADLKVILKNKTGAYYFLVSSHILSNSSKVWRRILYPKGFSELETELLGDSHSVRVMHLADDDALVLDLVFQIIHLKAENIPSTITFGFLRKIAILCDKYECGRVLNPWPKIWLADHEENAEDPMYEDWIFIAKALDFKENKVREISTRLITEFSSKSVCGTYVRRDFERGTIDIGLKHLPDYVQDYVFRERTGLVRKIIVMLRQFVTDIASANPYQGISNGYWSNKRYKLCKDGMCLDLALGSLIRSLKHLSLWPLLSSGVPHMWHSSVGVLTDNIAEIQMTTLIHKKQPDATAQKNPSNGDQRESDDEGIRVRSDRYRTISDTPDHHLPSSSDLAHPIRHLRYEYPAFDRKNFRNRYGPCDSAFALGKLITGCKDLVDGIQGIADGD